jgi:hypothetical protein
VDIIVYAHDDDNRVGVRALYYKDSDPWEDEPIGDEWIPFCDFIGEVVDCASGYSARTSISFQIEQMMITLVPDFQSWFCH